MDSPQRRVRVVIVDDDALVRAALRLILESDSGVTVLGEGADGRSGYDAYTRLAKMIAEDHGKLDAQIHLAAVCGGLRPLIHDAPESWLQGLQVNLTAPLWLFQTQRELLEAGTNPRVIFSLHSQHRVQSAYWHSYGVAQAALEKLIATLHAEKHAYPAIGFATVDPGWVDTPLSRAVYPAGQAHWRAAEAAVPLYLDALRGNPEPLEQHHA